MLDGQATPNETPETTETVTTVTDENPATPTNGVAPPENKSDTSGDVPTWLPARLERARENAVKDLLAGLGIESPEQIKATIAENQAFKEAQMTEQEKRDAQFAKLQEELEAERTAKTQLEQKIASFEQQQLDQRRETAMQSVLANTLNPKAVLLLIKDEYPEDYAQVLNEEGKVDDAKRKSLLEKVSAAHGALFRASTSVGSPPSANRGYTVQTTKQTEAELKRRVSNVFK